MIKSSKYFSNAQLCLCEARIQPFQKMCWVSHSFFFFFFKHSIILLFVAKNNAPLRFFHELGGVERLEAALRDGCSSESGCALLTAAGGRLL